MYHYGANSLAVSLRREHVLRTAFIHRNRLLGCSIRHSANSNDVQLGKSLPSRVSFALSVSDSKALGSHLLPQLFSTLHLSSFTKKEINAAFDKFDRNASGYLEKSEVRNVICHMKTGRECGSKIDDLSEQLAVSLTAQLDSDKDGKISKAEFYEGVITLGQKRDPRMWPYVGSMVMVGVSVGVVMPALPLLAIQLGVTQAQFGYITSGFGLAKLISNIPSGVCVEQRGRRFTMVAGCIICSVGYIVLAFSTSLEHMILGRFVMGGGAAFLMAGATMAVADISTSLNRARMMGPVMSGFSAGAAIGPAIGGAMIGSVGIESCFLVVSVMFFINALCTRAFTSETMLQSRESNEHRSLVNAVRETMAQWGPLCRDERLQQLLLVNAAYWVAFAGGTLTILPLMLTDQFALGPPEIGLVFAMQSMVSVLGTEPATRIADHFGPHRVLAPALATMAISFATLPMAVDIWHAMPPLILMALSNTVLSTAPTAAVANVATASDRAQSLALLRTAGDAGWLIGGISVGTAAGFLGIASGLQGTSAFLLASAVWFAVRGVRM